ncbi:short chain dehydrogenase [Nemania sp. FL0031]|nr:short chain dehydrogenase [Nemania sp. FL0031]
MAENTQESTGAYAVSGKTAIVTGAGSGINFSFAALLLSEKCNVVLADISLRPEAEKLIEEYSDRSKSSRAVFVKTDVTLWSDLSRMFSVTLEEFGDFDIVCPGAGVYEPHWTNFWHPPGSASSKDDVAASRYALLDINVTHPIRATQLALSLWTHPRPEGPSKASKANPKRVVHISSVAGQIGVFAAPLYGASKFAISGFVRCMAPLEQHTGVRVNAVAPGIVRTPLWTEHVEKSQWLDPARDAWVTPEEVAAAMLRCVVDPEMTSGTILEVGKDVLRRVMARNDPGPDPDPKNGSKYLINSQSQFFLLQQLLKQKPPFLDQRTQCLGASEILTDPLGMAITDSECSSGR